LPSPLLKERFVWFFVFLIWLELSFLPLISVEWLKPDLFAIFLTFYAFQIDRKHLLILALILGLAKDLLSNAFFGLETICYISGTVFLQIISDQFDRDKRWIQIVSVFLFTFFTLTMFSSLMLLVQPRYGITFSGFIKICFVAIYTMAVSFVGFPVLQKWVSPVFRQKQYELF